MNTSGLTLRTAPSCYKRVNADPADWFDADEVAKAKRYQRPISVLRAVSLVAGIGVFVALISTDSFAKVADAAGDNWVARLFAVIVFFMLVYSVVMLPFSIWATFGHEKKWGFSTQTGKGFVVDEIKDFVVGLVMVFPLMALLWWLIRSTDLWWIYGWAAFFTFSVVFAFLFPIVLAPIFNKFTPLEDRQLAERLRKIATDAGMHVQEVQVMDASKRTTKDNAYFAGMGKTRQIVLYDNILARPPAVIESVIAHELAHWRRRHIVRTAALGTVSTFATFAVLRAVSTWDAALDWVGAPSIEDPVAMPLLIIGFLASNAVIGLGQAWLSRVHERQADLDALDTTRDYDAFVDTHRHLATKNLADLAPSWWKRVRASHPPAAERLEMAKRWRESEMAKAG